MANINLAVRPGHKMRVSISFSADFEHILKIIDFAGGHVLKEYNNKSTGGGSWESPVNNSEQIEVYQLQSTRKWVVQRPLHSPLELWIPTDSRVIAETPPNNIVIFFKN